MPNSTCLEQLHVLDIILGTEGIIQTGYLLLESFQSIYFDCIIELPTLKGNKLREYIALWLYLRESNPTDICNVVKNKIIHINSVIFFLHGIHLICSLPLPHPPCPCTHKY